MLGQCKCSVYHGAGHPPPEPGQLQDRPQEEWEEGQGCQGPGQGQPPARGQGHSELGQGGVKVETGQQVELPGQARLQGGLGGGRARTTLP